MLDPMSLFSCGYAALTPFRMSFKPAPSELAMSGIAQPWRTPVGFHAGGTRDEAAGMRGGRPSRRDLVTGSLAGATAAAGAAALVVVPTEPLAEPAAANDLGYRETNHVRRYYALARH